MRKGKQNRDELLRSLQERLQWYMSEASDEEFDADEVEAIARLLEVMDGDNWEKPDVEAAYERFRAYCRERELREKTGRDAFGAGTEATEEFSEELAPERAAKTEKRRKSGKKRLFRRAGVAVAAALCFMFLGVGGVSMALNDGGWFTRLSDKHRGEDVLVVPNDEFPLSDYVSNVYYSFEEVNKEYKGLVPLLNLEDYSLFLEKIEIMEMQNRIVFFMCYVGDNKRELVIDINVFKDENVILHRETYDDMEGLKSRRYQGVEYSRYESYDTEKHYYFSFQWNNLLFNVAGDVELEEIDNIVCMLIDKII